MRPRRRARVDCPEPESPRTSGPHRAGCGAEPGAQRRLDGGLDPDEQGRRPGRRPGRRGRSPRPVAVSAGAVSLRLCTARWRRGAGRCGRRARVAERVVQLERDGAQGGAGGADGVEQVRRQPGAGRVGTRRVRRCARGRGPPVPAPTRPRPAAGRGRRPSAVARAAAGAPRRDGSSKSTVLRAPTPDSRTRGHGCAAHHEGGVGHQRRRASRAACVFSSSRSTSRPRRERRCAASLPGRVAPISRGSPSENPGAGGRAADWRTWPDGSTPARASIRSAVPSGPRVRSRGRGPRPRRRQPRRGRPRRGSWGFHPAGSYSPLS